MQIQISWLLKKPTDLNLHCLLRQGMSCSAREGLRKLGCLGICKAQNEDSDQPVHLLGDIYPASILLKSISDRYRPDINPVGPIKVRNSFK